MIVFGRAHWRFGQGRERLPIGGSQRMTTTDGLRAARWSQSERRAIALAASAHVIHDGYTDLLYVLLPVWQAEFGLGYAEVGMLRGSYMATMSALQISASL